MADKPLVLFWVGYYFFTRPWVQQSTWYRAFGPGHALKKTGKYDVEFVALDETARMEAYLGTGRVAAVILHRVPTLPETQVVLERVKALGVPLCFDIDDNIIETSGLSSATSVRKDSTTPLSEAERWAGFYRSTVLIADKTLCATDALAEAANRAKPGAAVVAPNYLPDFYFSRRDEVAPPSTAFRVFYGPGSLEHQFHLDLVESQISDFLKKHPDAVLVLGGGLPISGSLTGVKNQIERLPKLPPASYFKYLSSMDLVLAPLRATIFSRCKSWIKVLEASAQGSPWIASPIPDYEKFRAATRTGTIAADGEWAQALTQAYRERKRAKEEARASEPTIRRDYSWDLRGEEYFNLAVGAAK